MLTGLPDSLVMPQGWTIGEPGRFPMYKRVRTAGLTLVVWYNGFVPGWKCFVVERASGARLSPFLPDDYPSAIACMMAAEFKLAAGG